LFLWNNSRIKYFLIKNTLYIKLTNYSSNIQLEIKSKLFTNHMTILKTQIKSIQLHRDQTWTLGYIAHSHPITQLLCQNTLCAAMCFQLYLISIKNIFSSTFLIYSLLFYINNLLMFITYTCIYILFFFKFSYYHITSHHIRYDICTASIQHNSIQIQSKPYPQI
jgi:hypothetical protein